MSNYIVQITSVPDRDNLVAEIWLNDVQLAEISMENGELKLELFCEKSKLFQLEDFITALITARDELLSSGS